MIFESVIEQFELETEDEFAFYDALANNESAREVLGNKQLAIIAIEVFKSVKANAKIDWTLKERFHE